MNIFTVEQLKVGGFDLNFSYIVNDPVSRATAIVDPCGDTSTIWNALASYPGAIPEYILLTHGHEDHVSGLAEVKSFFPAAVCASAKMRSPHPDRALKDGDRLPFGRGFIESISAPGHTEDSMCFRLSDDSALFTGDTLFIDYIGFCNGRTMFRTLQRLKKLSGSLTVYSGHDYGHIRSDSLASQMKDNPFFAPDSEEDFLERLKTLS